MQGPPCAARSLPCLILTQEVRPFKKKEGQERKIGKKNYAFYSNRPGSSCSAHRSPGSASRMKVGILDILVDSPRTWINFAYRGVLKKQYASIVPQAVS